VANVPLRESKSAGQKMHMSGKVVAKKIERLAIAAIVVFMLWWWLICGLLDWLIRVKYGMD